AAVNHALLPRTATQPDLPSPPKLLPLPAFRSARRRVPLAVPSVTQGSRPAASLPRNSRRLPTTTTPGPFTLPSKCASTGRTAALTSRVPPCVPSVDHKVQAFVPAARAGK